MKRAGKHILYIRQILWDDILSPAVFVVGIFPLCAFLAVVAPGSNPDLEFYKSRMAMVPSIMQPSSWSNISLWRVLYRWNSLLLKKLLLGSCNRVCTNALFATTLQFTHNWNAELTSKSLSTETVENTDSIYIFLAIHWKIKSVSVSIFGLPGLHNVTSPWILHFGYVCQFDFTA